MNQTIISPKLILASKSPRRQELLSGMGLHFKVIPSTLDESIIEKRAPHRYVLHLAEMKAKEISQQYPDSFVIGADTVVIIDDIILEKPTSKVHARTMLETLSGRTHEVLTGFAVLCKKQSIHFSQVERTDVTFKEMSDDEISWYIETDEPYDKAGGYAIQGMGTFFVKQIKGSYTNVVGLPLCEVMTFLMEQGAVKMNGKSKGGFKGQ